jgi:transposase
MAGGRPTKYKPEFCDAIIEMAKTGASKAEMCLDLDIAWSTFQLWQETHEEFSASVKEAERLSQGWWEKNGRIATFGGTQGFNATSFAFNMKNRFKDDWKDKIENELSGKDGKPIETTSEVRITFVDSKHTDSESV